MKKKFLTLLSVCIFTAALVNAQEATTYRGAFAPAPAAMWTDNWTNWDPNNSFYPATTVTIAPNTVLTGIVNWTRNNTYKISGLVYVDSLATLNIEAGTVIRGDEQVGNSSLIVQRGGKIFANGTSCNPVVFTSNKAAGARAKGDWGGLIILGRAPNNTPGGNQAIEGITQPNPRVFHGPGTNPQPADNSGKLNYVRIEFGGFVFAPNNEINGLTMGSVGSGTNIDYVQVSFTNDDAFEWFGGTVNCKHLVAYRNLDDDFDTDNGYSGLVQYGLGVKDPAISDDPLVSTSEGFESDNDATGSANTPKTAAKFYNITQIGAFRCANNGGGITQPTATGFKRGARIRRNTEIQIWNSILMNNQRGLFFNGANALAQFRNNVIAMDVTTAFVAPYAGTASYAEDAATTTYLAGQVPSNTLVSTPCDVLTNAWDFLNPDYRPNSGGSGGAVAGTDLSPVIEIDNPLFTANQSADLLVDLLENGVGSSNGTITITIPAMSGWDIKVPGATPGTFLTLNATAQSGFNGTSSIGGGTPFTNGDWNFALVGGSIVVTSKTGITIPQGLFVQLGFVVTRKGATPNGTNQNFSANVNGGGDNTPANNGAVTAFGAN